MLNIILVGMFDIYQNYYLQYLREAHYLEKVLVKELSKTTSLLIDIRKSKTISDEKKNILIDDIKNKWKKYYDHIMGRLEELSERRDELRREMAL